MLIQLTGAHLHNDHGVLAGGRLLRLTVPPPQTGSISADQCRNPCTDDGGQSRCDDNAICLMEVSTNSFRCECKLGFRGDGFNCTDRCEGHCDNAGVCAKNERTGDPECTCTGSFTGGWRLGGVAPGYIVHLHRLIHRWVAARWSNAWVQSAPAPAHSQVGGGSVE